MNRYYDDYDPEMDAHYEFSKKGENKMFKKFVILILIVLMLLAGTFYMVSAKADTCVIHKGKVLWINYHALKAHLGHGDRKCTSQEENNDYKNDGNILSGKNQKVKVVDAHYENGVLFLTWRGFHLSKFRICFTENGKLFCVKKEKPDFYIATSDGYIGSINIKLDNKKYKIWGEGSKTDDGFILDLEEK